MKDEEYLRTHTVGELTALSGPICLVDYQPDRPHRFQVEAGRICSAIGARGLRIEHVGSTSVPELPPNEAAYAPHLEAVGYRLRIREPGWYGHRLFRDWLRTDAADRHL